MLSCFIFASSLQKLGRRVFILIINWFVVTSEIFLLHTWNNGPGRSVGMATGDGLDSPGIKSRWGEIFRTRPDRPWGPTSLLYNGYRIFPGVKRPGRGAYHPALLAPRSRMSRAIPLLPLCGPLVACYRVTFTFTFTPEITKTSESETVRASLNT
jgi:hypothetical protein